MLPILNITDTMTSSATRMDISESFRPEDLSKTDFFDFVSAPPPPASDVQNTTNSAQDITSDHHQPLQGFDQFWGAEKETQQRLETAIFEDLNRYCWTASAPPTTNGSVTDTQNTVSDNDNSGSSVNNNNNGNANSSTSLGPPVINNSDGQIYTITVLNSSSTDQWLRKEISNAADQTNGLDINLDTILSNYQFVKTECFAYDDSGFATAESTKDDINYSSSSASHQQQQQHPPPTSHVSTGVTTTSPNVLLDASMNGTNDMISYTDMTNNNNEWNIDRNGIKEWETCEANESPESLLRSALQGKGAYAKTTVHLTQNGGITVIPAQKDDDLRRVFFNGDQETLTFADSTLSNSIFDDSQNPQHSAGVVDDMFLSLDNAFSDEFEKLKRISNDVQHFCTAADGTINGYGDIIIESNGMHVNGVSGGNALTSNDITNNNSLVINHNSNGTATKIGKGRGSNGMKSAAAAAAATKKYKKSLNNNNPSIPNNNNNIEASTISEKNLNKNLLCQLTTASTTTNGAVMSTNSLNGLTNGANIAAGIRKERSLHYCSICSKGFKDKYSVNVHIRTHTGEKPFACSLCGKSFRQKAHLAKHYQTHLQKTTNGPVKSRKSMSIVTPSQQHLQQPVAALNVINA